MQIYFGSKVLCQDGSDAGIVGETVYDGTKRAVTHIIVARAERLGDRWAVPMNMVQEASEDKLYLYVTRPQLRQVPQEIAPGLPLALWHEAQLPRERTADARARPSAEQERALIPLQKLCRLAKDTSVLALDGPIGTLAGVKLGLYENDLIDIVVDTANEQSPRCEVSSRWIADISSGQVKLGVARDRVLRPGLSEGGFYFPIQGKEREIRGDRS